MATEPTAPPTGTAPPVAPSRGDAPSLFRTRADAFVAWLVTFYTFLTNLTTWQSTTATEVFNNAGEAATSASTATTKASEASDSADAAAAAADAAAVAAVAPLEAEIDAQAITLGEQIGAGLGWLPQYGGGSVALGSWGIRIPAGQTGQGSVWCGRWLVDGAANSGRRIRLTIAYEQSADFTRTVANMTFQVATAGSPNGVSRIAAVNTMVQIGNIRIHTLEYVLQGDETDLRPYIWLNTQPGVAATDETLTLISFVPRWLTQAGRYTPADEMLGQRIAAGSRLAGDPAYLLSMVNEAADAAWIGQLFNGATRAGNTVTIPSGQTGQTSLVHFRRPFDGAANTGRRIRIKLGYDLSSPFTRTFANPVFQVATAANPNGVSRVPASSVVSTVGSRRTYVIEYVVRGDETAILPYMQINGGGAAAATETITLTHWIVQYLTALSDMLNVQDETQLAREAVIRDRAWEPAAAYGGAPGATQHVQRTVAPSGGDYTTPNAALAALTDARAWKRYRVMVEPGVYTGGEFFDRDFVDFVGRDPELCRFRLFQVDGTSAGDISLYSAMYMLRNSRLDGLTVEVKNARYAIHLESGNGAPNRLQEINNAVVLHHGNDDAPANTWIAQYAVGSGLSSGQVVRARGSRFWAKNTGAFYYHTNIDFSQPSIVDIEGCDLSTDDPTGNALVAVAMGSRVRDSCRLVSNVLGGDIRYLSTPWLQTSLAKQPADHAEIQIHGHGNSPAVFRVTDFGRALRIDSATAGSGSSVAIAGDAVPLIFGDGVASRYRHRAGSPGFSAAVWGWGDVSGVAVGPAQDVLITSLGQRLGDCTSVNRTLTVTVDGGAPVNVVFDQNHTGQSNATVLGIINAALGGAATASLYAPGERYRPRFADEEQSLRNTSGAGMPFGTVCAFNGSRLAIRPMTSADDPALFAGIAWQDIEAGQRGRVKTSGWLPIGDVLRSDSGALAFNGTMSVGATPGRVQVGGTQGLLRAIRADAVEVAS